MADAPPYSPIFPPNGAPIIARKPVRPLLSAGSWAVGGDDAVADHPSLHHPIAQPNASTASSTSSPFDSSPGQARRSSFVSQPLTAFTIRKHRSGSISLSATPQDQGSPRKHRLSRSISASEAPTEQESQESPEHTSRSRSFHKASASSSRRPNLRMISTSISRSESRRGADHTNGLGFASQTPTSGGPPTGGLPNAYSPAITYQYIHETTHKRMATLEYLRKVHEGQVYYFNTVSYNPASLSALPSLIPSKLGKRATSYLLLGTSMTPLLEQYASSPLDYLRALGLLLSEFEQYTQLSSGEAGGMSFTKGRVGTLLKSGIRGVKNRRSSFLPESSPVEPASSNRESGLGSIADSFAAPPNMGHDFQYLQLMNLPFDPDFGASFATLTDVLIEAYAGLLALLPNAEACVPGVADAFAKTDKQMKKIMLGGMITEFGENTRKEAKTEVNGMSKLVLSGLM